MKGTHLSDDPRIVLLPDQPSLQEHYVGADSREFCLDRRLCQQ